MKYKRFEELPVWQEAQELARGIYALTKDRIFSQPGDLNCQLRRAALSVSNNIAEGFERGTTSELLYFLYIARGSAGEVRSMLRFCEDWADAVHARPVIAEMITRAESCSRQIRAWADNLQDSPIKGQRHLNQRSRQLHHRQKEAEAFIEELRANMKQIRPEFDS